MLTLYQAPRAWRSANFSPFCIKVELYLRMAEIPYVQKPGDPRKAPKGKIPYVRLEPGGPLVGDSSHIIDHLKERFEDRVDGHLSERQHALGHLVKRTLEEGTYWSGLYDRWTDEDHFQELKRVLFGSFMGPPLIWIVPDLVRKRVLGTLFGQGISRHTRAEIYALAQQDFSAIETLIETGPFLFGEKPTSYDAAIAAFASAIWRTPFAAGFGVCPPRVHAITESLYARYFPELA